MVQFQWRKVRPIFGYPHLGNLEDPTNVPVLFFYTLDSGPRTRRQALEDMERDFYAKYPTPREQESDEAKKEMESILSHKLQELDHEKEILTKEQSILLQKQEFFVYREKKLMDLGKEYNEAKK